ncbi:MAG: DUF3127 domain-containing protein [Bacteroidaceae bacterium]|nr:DUF3127 domain-containing protein [Bacteroidaceae bacterium]
MEVIAKVKEVVETREFNDKQGNPRKVTTILAEEITTDQYKDSFVIELWDKYSDAFLDSHKVGDSVRVGVAFNVRKREWQDKDGNNHVAYQQVISGFNVNSL